MPTRTLNPEVLVADEAVVQVGREEIDLLRGRVGLTERKRIRLCAHRGVDSPLHEMFIVLGGETYIRPHKHPGKAESLLVIEGAADAVFFEESGAVRQVVLLGDYGSGRRFYYRISEPYYHTLLLRSDPFVFHEATQGPFDRAQTVFAPWSPAEGDVAATRAFMAELAVRIGGHMHGTAAREAA